MTAGIYGDRSYARCAGSRGNGLRLTPGLRLGLPSLARYAGRLRWNMDQGEQPGKFAEFPTTLIGRILMSLYNQELEKHQDGIDSRIYAHR